MIIHIATVEKMNMKMQEEYNFCDDCVVHDDKSCASCPFNRAVIKSKKHNDIFNAVSVIAILVLFALLLIIAIKCIINY